MPTRRVPNPAHPIIATRYNKASVAVEVNSSHSIRVGGENSEALAGPDLPHPDGLVEGTGCDQIRLRVEGAAEGVVGMAREGLDGGGGLEVPDADGKVVGGGTKLAGVGGEGEVRDSLFVSGELGAEGEV